MEHPEGPEEQSGSALKALSFSGSVFFLPLQKMPFRGVAAEGRFLHRLSAFFFSVYIFPFTMVRAMRFFFSSTLTTQTFTMSPTFTTSEGWRMNFSAMREMWTRPS